MSQQASESTIDQGRAEETSFLAQNLHFYLTGGAYSNR